MAVTFLRADGATLSFDSVLSYSLSAEVSVTDHPIEDGSTISDHAQRQPKRLSVRAMTSETPYANVSPSGGPDRVKRVLEWLEASAGQALTAVTERYGTIENMCLTRYPTTVGQVRSLVFDIELKEIRIATAGQVAIPPAAPRTVAARAGLPDEQDAGGQGTTSTANEPAQEAGDQSLLLGLLSAVGADP